MSELPLKIKQEMLKQNLSARKLAKKAKVRHQTILDVINQKRTAHKGTLLALCLALGLDHDWNISDGSDLIQGAV